VKPADSPISSAVIAAGEYVRPSVIKPNWEAFLRECLTAPRGANTVYIPAHSGALPQSTDVIIASNTSAKSAATLELQVSETS
jgi:hypothetical protein